MIERVLAINPGSTSTKMAVFTRKGVEFELKVDMDAAQVSKGNVYEELDFRTRQIGAELELHGIENVAIVIGRGGLLKPMKSGAYKVCESMISDMKNARYGNHASNLGAALAAHFGKKYHAPAYIIDPVSVDEMIPEARISGVPGISRKSVSHALNIKATARRVCEREKLDIEKVNFIIVHLGGGISVCAMREGKNIDVNNALLGMGPFSPERAGALPLEGILDLVFRQNKDERTLRKLFTRESGLKGYLGTNDVREVVRRIHTGDKDAELIMNAMLYQVRKEIGAMAAVLDFKVDALIVTGGAAYSDYIREALHEHLSGQFRIIFHPGENELEAMADGGFRILDKKLNIYDYEKDEA
ncbi:MAG: butyrate kinase [Candidatus Marinimicrobia bacterium]|jgi:butyrate kinase|nr:butyrate kinase [Candidatus Neomarinimicrobiota bacterium]MDD4960845.1 butyrate kinase [Candidatus Neomarinimicrobiota bacterium]MDD5710213.1 butyrate kinase [Candidatus Neomarinimicrobiota bacterium]MDX9777634.1 butyrate kinase [bacterium]